MSNLIDERQKNLDATEALMGDLKDIAGTLQTNTKQQGEDLLRVDANVEEVKENAEDAH